MYGLWKKLFCLHDWRSHAKANYPSKEPFVVNNTYDHSREGTTTEILICKNCGKIKKIFY